MPAKSQIHLTDQEKKELEEITRKILTLGVGERLKFSLSLIKNKDEALKLSEQFLFLWRQLLRQKIGVEKDGPAFLKKISLEQIEKAIKNTEQVRKMLVANVNFHLALENLFLSYPRLK